jgi:hypothetical protein
MAYSKEKSFNNLILSPLSLITVLFEDLFGAVNIQNTLIDGKHALDPQPSISLLNNTETSDGFVIEGGIIKKDEYNTLKKEFLKLLEVFCVFGYPEFYKKMRYILAEAHKTIYGMNTTVPKKSWKFSI